MCQKLMKLGVFLIKSLQETNISWWVGTQTFVPNQPINSYNYIEPLSIYHSIQEDKLCRHWILTESKTLRFCSMLVVVSLAWIKGGMLINSSTCHLFLHVAGIVYQWSHVLVGFLKFGSIVLNVNVVVWFFSQSC